MPTDGARLGRNGRSAGLTRRDAKRLTRERLLGAARRLILAGGDTRPSASAVAREAGVGGATFYEHFPNVDGLLRALADELFADVREHLRQPRREAISAPTSEEKLRQQFRTPLEIMAANPGLFRLSLRVRHVPGSPLGESSRRLTGNLRTDIVEELVARGYPNTTPADRRRLEMIADIQIAATQALALGHLNGRYPDIEEMVDMLVLVTQGTRLVRERQGSAGEPVRKR